MKMYMKMSSANGGHFVQGEISYNYDDPQFYSDVPGGEINHLNFPNIHWPDNVFAHTVEFNWAQWLCKSL